MITTLIVIPLTTLQFIIIVGILAPVVCVVATLEAHSFATRHHRKWMEIQQAEIDRRQKVLDEAMELQANRDIVVTEREDAVTEREQLLRRNAEATAAVLHAQQEYMADDTLLMVMDEEWRP